jgi:hypothetical protein
MFTSYRLIVIAKFLIISSLLSLASISFSHDMSINASKLGWLKEFLNLFNIYFRVEKLLS